MAQVRNISSDAVIMGDSRIGVDELLDVPDEDFLDRAWPTSTWALVRPPASGRDVSPADAVCWTSTDATQPAPPAPPAPQDTDEQPDGQE